MVYLRGAPATTRKRRAPTLVLRTRNAHRPPEHLASSSPKLQLNYQITKSTHPQHQVSIGTHTRHTHNASQAAHPRLHRPANHHTLDTRAIHQIIRQRHRARHPAGHIRQICDQDAAAREVARHIHGVSRGCGRAAIPLCGDCWQLCTYHHRPLFLGGNQPVSAGIRV
jgi:hypothetical protein